VLSQLRVRRCRGHCLAVTHARRRPTRIGAMPALGTWEDTVTAIATAVTALSVPVGIVAIWLQLRSAGAEDASQMNKARLDRQAQIYQGLLDRADRIHLSLAMDAIRELRDDNYERFEETKSPETKELIRSAVDFFNDIQHLLEVDFVSLDRVEKLWTLSILSCADRLFIPDTWRSTMPRLGGWMASEQELSRLLPRRNRPNISTGASSVYVGPSRRSGITTAATHLRGSQSRGNLMVAAITGSAQSHRPPPYRQ
jgi:hypothetical protein